MGNKLTDKEILSNVLQALDITANRLKVKTGYKSSASFYHILSGENSITREMAEKICEAYPSVNLMYLLSGNDPVLLDKSTSTGQQNMFRTPKASFDEVPQTLKNIEGLLQQILDKLSEK